MIFGCISILYTHIYILVKDMSKNYIYATIDVELSNVFQTVGQFHELSIS